MKVIYAAISLVLVLLALVVSVLAVYRPGMGLLWLYVINTVIVALWYALFKSIGKRHARLPLLMALLWPGLGMLVLVSADLWFKNKHDESAGLAEYQKYIVALLRVDDASVLGTVSVVEEIDIMSGIDHMRLSTPSRKKEVLLHESGEEESHQIRLLRMALTDSDPDVKHYAATKLAALEDAFGKKIRELQLASPGDERALFALIDMYDKYDKSGLIDRGRRDAFLDEYAAVLARGRALAPEDKHILVRSFHLFLEQQQHDAAKTLLPKLEEKFPGQALPYILAMNLHYSLRDYAKVAESAQSIKKMGLAVPAGVRRMVDYWS